MNSNHDIQMVVSDLDGTLLREDLTITDATRNMVAALREAGIPFVIATGRSFLGMERFYRRIEPGTPAICYNGAAVFDGQRDSKLYEKPLPEPMARLAVELGRELDLLAQFYVDERLLVERRNADLEYYESITLLHAETTDFDTLPTLTPTKGMLLGDPDRLTEAAARLREEFGGAVYAATSKPRFLELLDGTVSKGETLRFLCAEMGIPMKAVIAFGDGRNDYELLETAGIGIAMPGGHPDLTDRFTLAAAANDDDGVLQTLRQYLPHLDL